MSPDQTTDFADSGFVLRRHAPLPALRADVYELEHLKSGARVLHVHNADSENCFAAVFPTPPPDNTGLPHILEHSVLGGSRKFPVREPFFEMVKMSMATFINAMTSQTYTVYPVATNVKKDFFNLVEVYLDAVFHPELKEETFRREGHHLTLTDNQDLASPLSISGIVYNEMKGAYSTPESLAWDLSVRGLFPDTPLGADSGGDPARIPELTFEAFVRFYHAFYHPSNARIFLYGDIPTAEHLAFLAPVLDEFDRRAVSLATPRQGQWAAPRSVERAYAVGAADALDGKTFMTLNWLVGDALDTAALVDWSVLSCVLLGNEAAPLKKALIDSHLGADLFFAGAGEHAYEMTFHLGLKGSEPDRVAPFERLVRDSLTAIAEHGITADRVEAAFQQLAYQHLEVTSQFPLKVLDAVCMGWPYGVDPVTYLNFAEHLEAGRRRYAADPRLYARLIADGLLDNPHRLRVLLTPDREVQARQDADFARRMGERRAALPAGDIERIAREAAALADAQSVPNSAEALAKLPQLTVRDLPARPRHIPTTAGDIGGVTVLRNDVFANGVNYLDIDIDLQGLPEPLYLALPRFGDAIAKMGAAGQSFMQIAERRAACTGGLGCSLPIHRPVAPPARGARHLRMGLKTLDAQSGRALALLGDILFGVDPRDRDRLRDVLTQARAGYRTALINDGMGTAMRRAARGMTPEGATASLYQSRETFLDVSARLDRFDGEDERLMGQIEEVREFLKNRRRWTVSFTGSDNAFRELERSLREWISRMADAPMAGPEFPFIRPATPPREGLCAPLPVAYCVKLMAAPSAVDPDAPLFSLGNYLVQFDYLLPEIRLKGNAYGSGATTDDGLGVYYLYSYRDPRIVETLRVFDGVRDFVGTAAWTQTDMDRAIIGSAKSAERPIRPGEATAMALTRHLRGDTDARREQRYQTSLGATPQSVKRAFLAHLDSCESDAAVCVVADRPKLEQASRTLPGGLDISALIE